MSQLANRKITPVAALGRVALVTGAAMGIGAAIAERLGHDGHTVVVADINLAAAEEMVAGLKAQGIEALALAIDVGDAQSIAAAFEELHQRFGRCDVLVNNAGIGEQSVMTLEQTVEGFDRILAVHLRGTFLASREAARHFVAQQSGAIVNLGSIAGLAGHPGRNAYGAAKAGIVAMTEAMASEWARDGIRVNAVAPGYVMTDLVRDLIARGALNPSDIEDRTPMARFARPEEIAEAIAFLASPSASYITGVTLPVDGGWQAFGAPPARLGRVADKRESH